MGKYYFSYVNILLI